MSTPSDPLPAHPEGLLQARQVLAQFLSLAFCEPRLDRYARILDPAVQEVAAAAAELVREALPEEPPALGLGEEPPAALRPELLEPLLADRDALIAAHQAVFGLLLSKDCPPYETEYCRQRSPVFRSQVMADVAGYYQAFGLQPAEHDSDRFDHLTLELEFLSWLAAKEVRAVAAGDEEGTEVCRAARERFFKEHALTWMPAFSRVLRLRVAQLGEGVAGYYEILGKLLAAWVAAERMLFGLEANQELPDPSETEAEAIPEACGGDEPGCSLPV